MGRRRDSGLDGFVVVDKPAGMTSHDVVAIARRELDTGRIGHAGTLDPPATGVLVLGVGKGTRLLRFVTEGRKSYEATIRFGETTTTLDAEGDVVARHPLPTPTDVVEAAAAMVGSGLQVPPMVSALKIDGVRLHQLARQGITVERSARPIHVERFEVEESDDPAIFTARIDCSAGTYVRVLAADLAESIGSGAHLLALRRTSVDPFGLDVATTLGALEVRSLLSGMSHLARLDVPPELRPRIECGAVLSADELDFGGDGPWALVDADTLLAVYERHERGAKPAVVVARPTQVAGGGRGRGSVA